MHKMLSVECKGVKLCRSMTFVKHLVAIFSEDLISEEEVLILHEEYQSGDCFPLWQYEPFNVANFDSSEA